MPDILHDFPVAAPSAQVFAAISTPDGLDQWWTKTAAGTPKLGATYALFFGPPYDWRAKVSKCAPNAEFELEMVRADEDWMHTRIGFALEEKAGVTQVGFHHRGWPSESEHYRISSFCWAMYLRVLKRHLEHGESVPYERRLEV
jgi:uncharacterized protein YndB with AHSA1/START domain